MLLPRQPPRTLVRRLLLVRRQQQPLLLFRTPPPKGGAPARLFTRHTNLASHTRPQLPFLSVPLSRAARGPQQFRYLTTERRRWLAYELLTAGKYTVGFWAVVGLGVVAYWSVQQEWLERRYPTPHDWRFLTRMRSRLARWAPDRADVPRADWVQAGAYARNVVDRLEDPAIDGAGLRERTDDDDDGGGGVWIDGGKLGYDLTAKSEPWRRGYHEALMLCARAAEHLDDHVVDTTRRLVFPADQVHGPSNPDPKPIAHGSPPAPREEDCERAYEPPEAFYGRILTARGFTRKQRMDAALAYASWLDFKGAPEASAKMHERALALASEGSPPPPIYDEKTYVLRDRSSGSGTEARKPSANVLTSLTALAAHKARNGDVTSALPILISILRARRSLPSPPSAASASASALASSSDPLAGGGAGSAPKPSPWTRENLAGLAKRIIFEPEYPPPPDDGEAPPVRDARELCEEAGLNLYIGEIIYASRAREDGLAWTREAVDLAEEQLHRLGGARSKVRDKDKEATRTCKECLDAGLQNWAKMVARLAREEREKLEEKKKKRNRGQNKGWLGLWGGDGAGENEKHEEGRWAAEEQVVKERTRRAGEILDELEAPNTGFAAIFRA